MHEFSKEASKQSEQHCLSLLQLDENKEMLQILTHISKMYFPYFHKDQREERIPEAPSHRVQFGGDQLTAERIRNCQKAIIIESSPFERLEDVLTLAEDFHCMRNFVNLIFAKFYDSRSMKDVGTMYQLQNQLNRRDVGKDTTKRYRSCNAFWNDVLDGYIVAYAVVHFNMRDVENIVAPPGMPKS